MSAPMTPDQLHVVSVISNPVRYKSRARLFTANQDHQAEARVTRWVIEAAFGDRPPEVADAGNPNHIIVRCDHELWLKEAMINAAAKRIPADAKYIMWQDADIEFVRPDWATETIQALQHYRVVQPFSHAIDLGPDGEVIDSHHGFAYEYERGSQPMDLKYPFMHPGFCWAWRREAFDRMGGLIDRALCGAGDHHMALSLIGQGHKSLPGGIHPNYAAMVLDWQARAEQVVQRDIGHVPGTILHYFHGWKPDRQYQSRWSILTSEGYDPQVDVIMDSQGMLRLKGDKTGLRDKLRRYFRTRMEDGGRKSWPA